MQRWTEEEMEETRRQFIRKVRAFGFGFDISNPRGISPKFSTLGTPL